MPIISLPISFQSVDCSGPARARKRQVRIPVKWKRQGWARAVPTGVAATVQGDRLECEDERVGKLTVAYTDGLK
jgi:hypothetical protein